jgi:UDP-3-O-[3-hydroxymyristoyl] glucosamine N-acyltransferase
MGDVPAGAEWVGSPAQPARGFFREIATLRRMIRDYTSGGARKGSGSGTG